MATEKQPFHALVAQRLIEQLRQGTAPWQKPWRPGEPSSFLPMNPTTGKRYRGINAMLLLSQGHSDQRWMTYKQAAAAGAQVRKGEKGTPIQYWKFADERTKTDAAGKPVRDAKGEPVKEQVRLEHARVFYATVFNAAQIDGLPLPLPRPAQTWDAIARAESILQASGATIRHGERGAFYRPATDSIHLPDKDQFASADGYYATALHELGHWTGHPTRLDRDLAHPYGSEGYAKEELRAEISSMILGDELGIGHDPEQHAAYVGSWIKALQEDPLEIFRAAADAEKIQEYILAREREQARAGVDLAALDQRRAAGILIAKEAGLSDPEQLVDLAMSTALAEKDGADITNDPVTGKDFNAFQLMDQLEVEGKPRMGEEFSQRRGYTDDQIADHQAFMAAYHEAVNNGADADSLQYALGVANGQLDIPPEVIPSIDQSNAMSETFSKNPAQLNTDLANADQAVNEIATKGIELDPTARTRIVNLVEHAMATRSVVAEGNDPMVAALNKAAEPHHRAAMGVARSLAVHDGSESRNPFTHEQLSRAYDSEFKHNQRLIQADLAKWEREQGDKVEFEMKHPSPSALEEIRADYRNDATMADRPAPSRTPAPAHAAPEVLASTFSASQDVEAKLDAARRFPELTAAFAYESALSRFADERLSAGERSQFMAHQRTKIASDIEAGVPLPVVRIRGKESAIVEETEIEQA
jgi:antirestriction protein ArdC